MALNLNLMNTLMGVIITISLGLSGFSLKWQFDANADLKVIKEQIEQITIPAKESPRSESDERL